MRFFVRGATLSLLLVLLPAASAAAAPTVSEFPIAQHDTNPLGIASMPNGIMIFAEGSTSNFGIGTSSGQTMQVSGLSARPPAWPSPTAVWLTEPGAGKIARVTFFGTPFQTLTEYSLPGGTQPQGITAGPDGNVWFTEAGGPGAIGKITPSGTITQYPVGPPSNSQPTGITTGPDGNLWFTETGNPGAIGKITPSGTITQYPVGPPANSRPTGIAAGPDGNLWFTEAANPARIGKITPAGTITEYSAGLTANSDPTAITAGPGGDLWFVENANPGAIGWITPQGAIQQVPTPTTNSAPAGITEVPDGDLWFTEDGNHGQLGQVTVPPPPTVTDPAFAVGDTSAILAGTVNPNGISATYQFQWGTSSSYGQTVPSPGASAGSGSTPNPVSQTLTGLAPNTTYHYRLVATNCGGCQTGTADGSDLTFTTASPPVATPPTTATTPTTTTVAPPAVPAPVAAPTIGQTAVAAVTSGTVLVRVPGSGQLQPLAGDQNIPIGSLVDARNGRLDVTTAISRAGQTQSAAVWGGEFVLKQSGARGLTTFRLADPKLNCPTQAQERMRASTTGPDHAVAAKKKKKAGLWASDHHGQYSTRGNNSVATVRGTVWETVESCRGTLTHVKKGRVSVLDLHTHRVVLVHAGHSFLARP